jgi:Protein of unknown function with HXXEE motif
MAFTSFEEYQLNWRDWARAVIGLPVEWSDFYVVNALVMVFGIVAANLARHPGLALSFPALMLINATFFHVLPFARTGGRYSPGLATWCCSIRSASPAIGVRRMAARCGCAPGSARSCSAHC